MKYYLVKCKFGHVGRTNYLPLVIPVVAQSIKEASEKAKNKGGVKRDHKDWCLERPTEVTREVYRQAKYKFKNDIYFESHSRQRLEIFKVRLVKEKNYTRINGIKTNKKRYIQKRNKNIINFKRKKQEVIIKSKIKEQFNDFMNYTNNHEIIVGG